MTVSKRPKTTTEMDAAVGESTDLLHQKVELATRAVDSLMFTGEIGNMIQAMAQMAGIPAVSLSLIFPNKKPNNMRPFLVCLLLIINIALDDQVGLDEFLPHLADAKEEIERIMDEEK